METSRFNEFRVSRRIRAVNRSVQIALSLSLIFALNYLASRYFERFDLTQAGIYSLAAESKGYLRELKEPIDIIITFPDSPEAPELERIHGDLSKLLREYKAQSMREGQAFINVEFVDIHRQRKRAQDLVNKYGLQKDNVVIVANGERTKEIELPELYEAKDGQWHSFRGEKVITSAIIEVSSKKIPNIYFLTGHGEMRIDDIDALRGLSQMDSFLRERGFNIKALDLTLLDAVPEDADLIVIPSPQASLLPAEVEKLRRYMSDRNGRMIVSIDPGRRHGMDNLFFDWGVMADDMVVIDIDPQYRTQDGDLIIRHFAEHPISKLLFDYKATAYFGQPRPIRKDPLAEDDERLQVSYLMGSSQRSWAEKDYRSEDPIQYNQERDLMGPLSIATASMRSAGTELGISIPGGRLVVFGNSDFIANNRFQTYGNYTLFINSVNWALDRSNLLNIPTRPLESHQLVMSRSDLHRLLIYFAALPGVVAIFGLSIYILRRR